MAIQDDFTIDTAAKAIRHSSGTTVYSSNAFYSWLMDTFDEPAFMSYQTPMRFNTPTSYSMLNGWFIDNGDGSNALEFLTGGSIDTVGYATVADPVYMLDLTSTTDWVTTDKGKVITDDASNVGPLLAYLNDYPVAGSARIWVRDTNSNGTIATSSAIATASGTGAGTANGASVNGDENYTNLYTIAAFPGSPNPQVYIYQNHPQSGDRTRIAEWSGLTNFDRGPIDILIPTRLGGSLIDGGNVLVLVRQSGDTFTFVEADLSSGDRTPVATETAADNVNITQGEHYLLYDGSNTGSFSPGDVITDIANNTGAAPGWYAEVVAVTEFTDTTTGLLELRGLRGTITDNDNIYVGATLEGVANGTPGDTYATYDTETVGPVAGDIGTVCTGGTSGAKRILRGYNDAGTSGALVLQDDPTGVTGTARDAYYLDFVDNDAVTSTNTLNVTLDAASTTVISGFNDITICHINGTVAANTFGGTFLVGERITWDAGSSEGIVVKTDGSSSITIGNVNPTSAADTISGDTITGDVSGATCVATGNMVDANTDTFAFEQQSAFSYAVVIQGGDIYNVGRTLSDIYAYTQYRCRDGVTDPFYTSDGSTITEVAAEEYLKAKAAYAATKPAPFGTLAGAVFFAAQGVWIEGQAAADANNIRLTDDTGTLRQPFVSVNVVVGNTRVDDVITVHLQDGSGLPDKTQFTSDNTANVQGDSTFVGSASFPIDTPASGTFTVVDNALNEEHRYRYDSWTGNTLTMPTERTGTAGASSTGTTLDAPGATFVTWGIQRGDIIRRTNGAGGYAYVEEVTDEDTLTTTLLSAGSGWANTETFALLSLVETYTNADTFFIPYLDRIEDTGTDGAPGSETQSLLFLSNRNVVVRVRNVKNATPIQPFVTTSTISDTGLNISVIRNEDTVYT